MKKASKEIKPLKLKPSELIILLTAAALVIGFTGFIVRRVNMKNYQSRLYKNSFADTSKTYTLNEFNKSGENGKVTLKEINGKLVVSAYVNNAPRGTSQPMHIHRGTCSHLGDILYNLTNLKDGSSITNLETSVMQLATQAPLTVNIHKSSSLMKVNVSCADLTF